MAKRGRPKKDGMRKERIYLDSNCDYAKKFKDWARVYDVSNIEFFYKLIDSFDKNEIQNTNNYVFDDFKEDDL